MIEIYTDGACRGNQSKLNIGAWAYTILSDGNQVATDCSYQFDTTNNCMELTAIFESLKKVLNSFNPELLNQKVVTLYTDSSYSIGACTTWKFGWKRNGWKKSDGSEILNLELIKNIDYLMSKINNIKFIKVKGHSNNPYNNYVDKLCNDKMDYISSLNK